MAIAFVQGIGSDFQFGSTTQQIVFNSIPTDNDIIVLCYENTVVPGASITWPTGFTQLFNGSGGSSAVDVKVAWKRANGESSATYTVTLGASTDNNQLMIGMTFSGVNTSSAIDVSSSTITDGAFSSPIAIPGITTVTANAMHIIVPANSDTVNYTTPSNYSRGPTAQAGGSTRLTAFYRLIASPGSTGTVNIVYDANTTVAGEFALTPAPLGTPIAAQDFLVFPKTRMRAGARGI